MLIKGSIMKVNKISAVILFVLALSVGVTGCVDNNVRKGPVQDADIISLSHRAADSLIRQAGVSINKGSPIVAASFANIDNLNNSSSFGRIVSQQLASRFTQNKYQVVEMLLREKIYIKEKSGEFLLSRALRNISAAHNAQAVIVGTYAVGAKNIYITAKIVRATDSVVLSSHDYTLPIGPDMRKLLRR